MGLDQYAFITREDVDPTNDTGGQLAFEKDFYWRKHSKLQEYMEQLWTRRTGRPEVELNCNYLELEAHDILDLLQLLTGEKGLPESKGGFFYGHQFQDESANQYREDDIRFVQEAYAAISQGKRVWYSCWW